MPDVRLSPPADGLRPSITVNGRTYACAIDSTIDVPDFDARVMTSNGWTPLAMGVGTTANRPANPKRNENYIDTSLGVVVRWDGKSWRNVVNGAKA